MTLGINSLVLLMVRLSSKLFGHTQLRKVLIHRFIVDIIAVVEITIALVVD